MSEQVSFGYADVDPADKTAMVGDVFRRVARRYDLMNDLMSGGLHRLWKDHFVRRVRPRAGEAILDMAGGTGDIAFRMARSGAHVTVADINPAMLEVGQKRAAGRHIDGLAWAEENAEALSFPDRRFDAYTIAFGIRNVTHIEAALAEARRVLKPGGRFLCLEFSKVEMPGLDALYDTYSFRLLPKIGGWVAKDEDSYRYLAESIRKFPPQAKFAQMIADAGLSQVKVRNLSGGIAAMHSAWRL